MKFCKAAMIRLNLLYEAYDSLEGAAAHKQTPHYLKWKETVAPYG
jgi:autoinducer 2-degrading protein